MLCSTARHQTREYPQSAAAAAQRWPGRVGTPPRGRSGTGPARTQRCHRGGRPCTRDSGGRPGERRSGEESVPLGRACRGRRRSQPCRFSPRYREAAQTAFLFVSLGVSASVLSGYRTISTRSPSPLSRLPSPLFLFPSPSSSLSRVSALALSLRLVYAHVPTGHTSPAHSPLCLCNSSPQAPHTPPAPLLFASLSPSLCLRGPSPPPLPVSQRPCPLQPSDVSSPSTSPPSCRPTGPTPCGYSSHVLFTGRNRTVPRCHVSHSTAGSNCWSRHSPRRVSVSPRRVSVEVALP